MNPVRSAKRCALAVMLCLTWVLGAGPAARSTSAPDDAKPPEQQAGAVGPVTVAGARAQAKLLHQVYAATLEVMHHHFFKRDRSVLPARALEDVFAELDRGAHIKAAWISVNTKPMSIHHEPRTPFEQQAAKAIAAGKGEFELVENGVYQRAGAIPLGAGCISCHTGFFSKTPQTQRFAGLVIRIPLNDK